MDDSAKLEAFVNVETIVRQIVQRFHPCQVLLFGSYASGKPTPDSDVDVLIVVPHPPGTREAHDFSSGLQARFPLKLQLLFMSEQEFEETRDVIGGIAYPASHAGKVLYAQNS